MKAKAYGKVLVFGAYALLEPGNIGLVVNVSKGTTTEVESKDIAKYVFDKSELKITVNGNKKDLSELKFLRVAVDCVFEYFGEKGILMRDVMLSSVNDPELSFKGQKTGFGSSATSIVSAVAALLKLHDIEDRDLVYKLARFAHYKAQGSGSGFDISSACYGSHYLISDSIVCNNLIDFIAGGSLPKREEFMWPGFIAPIIVFTGKSASTEHLIKKVFAFKKSNIEKYNEFMVSYNKVNLLAKNALDTGDPSRIKNALEVSWSYRKRLGDMSGADIEPEYITEIISDLKLHGAITAGLTGAGGGDILLVLCNPIKRESLINFITTKGMAVLDVEIMNQGFEFLS